LAGIVQVRNSGGIRRSSSDAESDGICWLSSDAEVPLARGEWHVARCKL